MYVNMYKGNITKNIEDSIKNLKLKKNQGEFLYGNLPKALKEIVLDVHSKLFNKKNEKKNETPMYNYIYTIETEDYVGDIWAIYSNTYSGNHDNHVFSVYIYYDVENIDTSLKIYNRKPSNHFILKYFSIFDKYEEIKDLNIKTGKIIGFTNDYVEPVINYENRNKAKRKVISIMARNIMNK